MMIIRELKNNLMILFEIYLGKFSSKFFLFHQDFFDRKKAKIFQFLFFKIFFLINIMKFIF